MYSFGGGLLLGCALWCSLVESFLVESTVELCAIEIITHLSSLFCGCCLWHRNQDLQKFRGQTTTKNHLRLFFFHTRRKKSQLCRYNAGRLFVFCRGAAGHVHVRLEMARSLLLCLKKSVATITAQQKGLYFRVWTAAGKAECRQGLCASRQKGWPLRGWGAFTSLQLLNPTLRVGELLLIQ